jgi:hypothetical protein
MNQEMNGSRMIAPGETDRFTAVILSIDLFELREISRGGS